MTSGLHNCSPLPLSPVFHLGFLGDGDLLLNRSIRALSARHDTNSMPREMLEKRMNPSPLSSYSPPLYPSLCLATALHAGAGFQEHEAGFFWDSA